MYTEASKRACKKYSAKAYDRLDLRIYKGQSELIKKQAAKNNESVNSYINRLIANDIGDEFKSIRKEQES